MTDARMPLGRLAALPIDPRRLVSIAATAVGVVAAAGVVLAWADRRVADARAVTVRLSRENGSLSFSVDEDGVGFDPTATPAGAGLTNMRDRLEALGGSVDVRSSPGGGTRMRGHIPIAPGSAP